MLLASASALASLNLWTGAPLLAMWVGSRVADDSGLSMGAVFMVVVVLLVLEVALTVALGWLSARYDTVTGRLPQARRASPWLRSLRGEREDLVKARRDISPIERLAVLSVVGCVAVFEFWFFFLAGSSLPLGGA